MKKKLTLTALALLALLALVWMGRPWYAQPQKAFEENQAAAEEALAAYLDTGLTPQPFPGVSQIYARPTAHPILEFTTHSSGLVSSSTYRGFYYSFDGVSVAFQGADVPLTEAEDGGWTWQGEGDNGGRTRAIGNNWFVFEAHF